MPIKKVNLAVAAAAKAVQPKKRGKLYRYKKVDKTPVTVLEIGLSILSSVAQFAGRALYPGRPTDSRYHIRYVAKLSRLDFRMLQQTTKNGQCWLVYTSTNGLVRIKIGPTWFVPDAQKLQRMNPEFFPIPATEPTVPAVRNYQLTSPTIVPRDNRIPPPVAAALASEPDGSPATDVDCLNPFNRAVTDAVAEASEAYLKARQRLLAVLHKLLEPAV